MALPSKQHAFIEACYELYEQKMFRVALAILRDETLAEDAVQDAFIKYYKSLSSFKGECSELTWIRKIVKNLWIDQQRKKGKIEYVSLSEDLIDEEAEFIGKMENKE